MRKRRTTRVSYGDYTDTATESAVVDSAPCRSQATSAIAVTPTDSIGERAGRALSWTIRV
jgi:hypothetical protein